MSGLVVWLAFAFCAVLAACIAVPLLAVYFRWIGREARRAWNAGCVVFAALVMCMTYKGATKNIVARFARDPGITVTSAEINIASNATDATSLIYSYTGTNDFMLPLWVRNSVSNEWAELGAEWRMDGRVYDGGTNTVTWIADPPASNIVAFAMYYLGFDPPPVEVVESGGVEVLGFGMTSGGATIEYAVDGAVLRGKVGNVFVESAEPDSQWAVRYATNHVSTVTNTVTCPGFFIDRTTRWRVRMEVPE